MLTTIIKKQWHSHGGTAVMYPHQPASSWRAGSWELSRSEEKFTYSSVGSVGTNAVVDNSLLCSKL